MKRPIFSIFFVCMLIFSAAHGQLTYNNPILGGFYPDPSICRVGDEYYLVNSSFEYFPGLPIMQSKDLVNWVQIGNAMNRNEQFSLAGGRVSQGLFAPTIRYHEGIFYIICTNVTKGGNFIITATDPKGPWSDPIYLPEVNGIDPSLFFDDDGRTYITYNSVPPDNQSLYNGHRTIRLIEYDVQRQKTIGENKIIVNGGSDISKHPVWIEGPHLYKIKGLYYLMCAEGGTAEAHSEVIFRSKNLSDSFVAYKDNPILTQRDLNPSRANPITCTGHADLVETPGGKWYAVFLGCRPYIGDYFNTGRETFMVPVTWKDGWPIIVPSGSEVARQYPVPYSSTKKVESKFSGDFLFADDFSSSNLNFRFVMLRNPTADLYKFHNGKLELPLKPVTVAQFDNPAFIGFRQSNLVCSAKTRLFFNTTKENESAGLLIFQSESHYYYLCKSVKNNEDVVELFKSVTDKSGKDELIASVNIGADRNYIDLKISADKDKYSFYYSTGANKWKLLKADVNGKFLSTKEAGGFVGSMFGLYGTSNGIPSVNVAKFDWFEYKGEDI
ncbi:glycoside hydrolase family 43 protein [Arachidicoccus ginsenosidivorans]|nr:glycoside hydrolase family 43 protein [Arachidicoccus ginsenosidivorans]